MRRFCTALPVILDPLTAIRVFRGLTRILTGGTGTVATMPAFAVVVVPNLAAIAVEIRLTA